MTKMVITVLVMTEQTVTDLLNMWPNRKDLVTDMQSLDADVTPSVVNRWFQRQSIKPRYWWSLVKAAKSRGLPITSDALAQAHHVAAPTHSGSDQRGVT